MTTIETSVFGRTIETSNKWLEALRRRLGDTTSDEEAFRALRATLQTLRDALTLAEVGHLSAQLPLLLRGVFLEGWKPTGIHPHLRREHEFLSAVQQRHGRPPIDARRVVSAVFGLLQERVSAGEIEDVQHVLPQALRDLWPQAGAPGAQPREEPSGAILSHAVGQFMSRDILTVSASAPLQDALELMANAAVRHLVVLAPDQVDARPIHVRSVVGMLSDRDALDILRRHPDENVRLEWHLVRDVMTHAPLITITPDASLAEAAAVMHDETFGALGVVDGQTLVGILTSDDLLYAGSLPGGGEA